MKVAMPKKKMDKRPVPKEPGTKERYEQQIANIEADIREFSAKITYCDKQRRHWYSEKQMFQAQQSKKNRYLNQLKKDYENIIQNWKEI
jgi:hypothetical protein